MTPDELSLVVSLHVGAIAIGIPAGLWLSHFIIGVLNRRRERRENKEPWMHLCRYGGDEIIIVKDRDDARSPS